MTTEPTDAPELPRQPDAEDRCRATKTDGTPCLARPMSNGVCTFHGGGEHQQAARRRGGKVAQARRALQQARADALQKLGADPGELLPSLESIGAMSTFLAQVMQKTADRTFSPSQASALIAGLRLGKDLLALGLEVKLLEQMEKADAQPVDHWTRKRGGA